MTNPQGPPTGPARDPLSTRIGDVPPAGSAPVQPTAPAPYRSPAPAPPPAAHQRSSTGRTIGRTLALALLLTVTVLLVLFVVFNTQTVEISLVFTEVRAPLVLALLIAAGLGALLVALAGVAMKARRRGR